MASTLPNFVIAGVPKAGTSTLFRWLADHPAVSGSKIKETFYFLDEDSHAFNPQSAFLRQGLEGYHPFFDADEAANASLTVESTPAYIYAQTARTALAAIETKPKFLFLLREPVSQIRSVHTYFSNNFQHIPSDLSFADFIELAEKQDPVLAKNELCQRALSYADYAHWLDLWRSEIGDERMIVHLFEDMIAGPQAYMKGLAAMLGIDPAFYDTYEFPKENESYRVRSPLIQALNVRVRELLPKDTALYRGLRTAYRRINTTGKKAAMNQHDQAAITKLKSHFTPLNARLAKDYGLDLTRWH